MKGINQALNLSAFSATAFADVGDCHMVDMMGYGFMGLGWFGMIFWVLFWVVIIAAVLYFFNLLLRERRYEENALEMLKRRYVRGEISEKEFKKMKKELE